MMNPKYLFTSMLLFLIVSSYCSFAQTKVFSYDYDNSGNRIEREFIQLKSASIATGNEPTDQQEEFNGELGNQKVKIYPNPTKGTLKIELPHNTLTNKVYFQVFDINGSLILSKIANNKTTRIFLNDKPSGIYLLRISSDSLMTEWKIIKE